MDLNDRKIEGTTNNIYNKIYKLSDKLIKYMKTLLRIILNI